MKQQNYVTKGKKKRQQIIYGININKTRKYMSHPKKKNPTTGSTGDFFLFTDLVLWSRHLVFWSLGTLTGLRDRVHGLFA